MLSEFRFIHSLHTITKCCTKCINPVLSSFICTQNLVKKTAHTNSNGYFVQTKYVFKHTFVFKTFWYTHIKQPKIWYFKLNLYKSKVKNFPLFNLNQVFNAFTSPNLI